MIRVAIADDHPIVRLGLRRIATEGGRIAVTGEAATAAELFRLVAGAPVDVVLLDVSMPGSTFVETVRDQRLAVFRRLEAVRFFGAAARPFVGERSVLLSKAFC